MRWKTGKGIATSSGMEMSINLARIEDTWSVVGMRGTGSQDFVVDDVFVPDAHTCFLGEAAVETGPLYNPRLVLVTLFTAVVANSLGIARGALDAFIELATRESSTYSRDVLRDRPLVQARLARPRQLSIPPAPTSSMPSEPYGMRFALGSRTRASPLPGHGWR